jgi:hypothetical protein
MKSINLEQWIEKYKPIFSGEELKDFDLFKDELQQISNYFIWTEISCENEEFYIIPGFHWVNKFRVFVTEIPWENENIEVDDNEMCSIDAAIDYCIDFGEKTFKMGFDKNDVTLHFNENVDFTFDGKITIGKAKYTAMSYYEDRLEKNIEEFENLIHDYYSQL